MAIPGVRNIIIGAVILAAAVLFRSQLTAGGAALLFYGALIIGAVLLGYGLMEFVRDRNKDDAERQAEKRTLANEVLFRTLSRMSSADTNIRPVEVETIRNIYRDMTGDEVSISEVRVAAQADLYERQPFKKYLAGVQAQIDGDDKRLIMKALSAVIKADGRISPFEVDFFNEVAEALKLSPADLTDLADESDASGATEKDEARPE